MNRLVASILAIIVIGLGLAWGAGETRIDWGLAPPPGTNPRNVCVFDQSHTCVTLGALDSIAHTLTIPSSIAPGGGGGGGGGLLLAGGTAVTESDVNHQSVSTSPAFTATNGQAVTFIAAATNTGNFYLNAGSGDMPMYLGTPTSNDGTTGGLSILTGCEIVAGNPYIAVYYNLQWYLLNPTADPYNKLRMAPSTVAAFTANSSAVEGIPNSPTTGTLVTKRLNAPNATQVGSFYNLTNSSWTPPPGPAIIITFNVLFQYTIATDCWVFIYKNGTEVTRFVRHMELNSTDGNNSLAGSWIDIHSDGTSYYQLYAAQSADTGGKVQWTRWQGSMM